MQNTGPEATRAAGYVIIDAQTGRPYVPRIWPTEREAEAERSALLRGYPSEHEWHTRLLVQSTYAPAEVIEATAEEPPEGPSSSEAAAA